LDDVAVRCTHLLKIIVLSSNGRLSKAAAKRQLKRAAERRKRTKLLIPASNEISCDGPRGVRAKTLWQPAFGLRLIDHTANVRASDEGAPQALSVVACVNYLTFDCRIPR